MDGWFTRGMGGHARLRRGGVTPPYKLIEKLAVEADVKHRPAWQYLRVRSIEADEDDTKKSRNIVYKFKTLHIL